MIQNIITEAQARMLYKLGIKGSTELYYVDFTGGNECGTLLCRESTPPEQERDICWWIVGAIPPNLFEANEDCALNADNGVFPAYTLPELVTMFGKSTPAIEQLYNNVLARLNCGISFDRAYDFDFIRCYAR